LLAIPDLSTGDSNPAKNSQENFFARNADLLVNGGSHPLHSTTRVRRDAEASAKHYARLSASGGWRLGSAGASSLWGRQNSNVVSRIMDATR
jgi:hypothetical protein